MRHVCLKTLALALLSAAAQADAWTPLPPGPGSRVVYVSSSLGNNGNDGLSAAAPKQTVAAGFALLRDGFGDHLLLRRGDTFPSIASLIWNKSGASAQQPMVFGAYGSGARPRIDTGSAQGLAISPGYQSPNTVRHVAIVHLHFYASTRDPGSPTYVPNTPGEAGLFVVGAETTAPVLAENLLVEGCRFEFMGNGIVLLGGPNPLGTRDVRLRRNLILDSYQPGAADVTGIFASRVTGLLIEENLIDNVQRAPGTVLTVRQHGMYIQSDSRDVTISANIITRAPDGAMQRPGGVFQGNLMADVGIGNHQGYIFGGATPVPGGVGVQVLGNAVVGVGTGSGLQAGNVSSGRMAGNLLLSGATTGGTGLWLLGSTDLGNVGVHDLLVQDNVVLGLKALQTTGDAFSLLSVRRNRLQSPAEIVDHINAFEAGDFAHAENAYHSGAAASAWFRVTGTPHSLASWTALVGESGAGTATFLPPASAPDVASYHAEVLGGTATLAAFVAEARQQGLESWRAQYTAAPVIAYLRRRLGYSAKGDLDRDGRTDLFFRNSATGQNQAWVMNGTVRAALVTLTPSAPSLAWEIAGTDDFNADGHTDLLFWNSTSGAAEFWLMNGTARVGSPVPLGGALPLPWRPAATADLDHNGRPDVLWRNEAACNVPGPHPDCQKLRLWSLNGTLPAGELQPKPAAAVDANWSLVGALDLDGDTHTDLLWYNATSGRIVYWTMVYGANASACAGQGLGAPCLYRSNGQFTSPSSAGDNNWKVLAAGDYGIGPAGLAGSQDLVWRNATSGRVVVWHMDYAGTRTSGTFTDPMEPAPNPTSWTIVGPR